MTKKPAKITNLDAAKRKIAALENKNTQLLEQTEEYWDFKYPGPQGIYLSGREATKVKNGPPPGT